MRRVSLAMRLTLLLLLVVAALALVSAAASALGSGPAGVLLSVLLAGALLAPLAASSLARSRRRDASGLRDAIASFRDGDFSMRVVTDALGEGDEIRELGIVYNDLADALRRERLGLRQRELLLESALEASPMAVVLVDELDRVVHANLAARRLLHRGRRLEGETFAAVVRSCPEPLSRALSGADDALVTVALESGDEVFAVARRAFEINARRHLLYTLRHMTPSLRRAEVATWKKVIRILSHELNNTIAPLSSLFHSARLIRGMPELADGRRLDEVFSLIEDALGRLRSYVEGYAQFARLPEPRPEAVDPSRFLEGVAAFEPLRIEGAVPEGELSVDPGQLRQVLVNLLKNAREAGSADTTVALAPSHDGGLVIEVRDRGPGMDAAAMQRALLPFQSSKPAGTGLGLAISREIVEAHGGTLELASRDGGGLVVRCNLPPQRWRPAAATAVPASP